MKITGIEIGEYHQFKNIKFDFTYPEGHAKAGQPLEKVCFIGQSGTGKSTLLSLIHKFFISISKGYKFIDDGRPALQNDDKDLYFSDLLENIIIRGVINEETLFTFNGKENGEGENVVKWIDKNNVFEFLLNQNKICVFVPDSVAGEAESILSRGNKGAIEKSSLIKTNLQISQEDNKRKLYLEKIDKAKVIKIVNTANSYVWQYLLKDIISYDERVKHVAVDMIQKSSSFSADKLFANINNWKKKNPNPRIELAEKCLNLVLSKFFLEVDLDNSDAPLVIRTKGGKPIQSVYLSTGTKQILTTAVPAYVLGKGNVVLLFDEPERSLFPDIQRGLIDYYTSLAPEAQFFFATHSPIIASAFEPCERFILYFDENGEVNFHNGVAPEGDDPNDILSEDFGMDELMLPKGLEEYKRYRRLAVEIRNEKDAKRKDELIVERAKLGDLYRF